MKIIAKIWQKFKNEPDVWFFYGFLLVFALSVRKIIYFFPIKDNFNEYSAISLYLSDIFIFLTLTTWAISILCNKYNNLSSILSAIHSLYRKKWWITCWERLKCSTWNSLRSKLVLIPLLLVIWGFLSVMWSDNKVIAFYRSAKFLEFFLLYIYIKHKMSHACPVNCSTWNIVPRGTISTGWNILKNSFLIIIFLGLFQSIIGIWQFIIQHSIGLFWLKESLMSVDMLGIAKAILGSQKYIRAYGLFPHPNILGGFLLVSIIFTILYRKMFHLPAGRQAWNIWITKTTKIVPRGTFWWVILNIQVIALILTFSKSAILGLIIALVYIFINQHSNVPCLARGAENVPPACRQAGVEHLRRYFILSLIIFGFLLFYFKVDLYFLFIKSLDERFLYLTISIKAIMSHIFFGLGNGQFVLEMQKYASASLEYWQFQPVHNIFLLILSELGIVGLFLFIWFLLELFHVEQFKNSFSFTMIGARKEIHNNVPRGTLLDNKLGVEESSAKSILHNNSYYLSSITISTHFKAILLGFIFIMLFDHYFWDIQQGQIILWMVMGVIAGLNIASKRQKDS